MSEKREPCEHNDYCERSPEFTEPRGYCCPAGATREAGGDCTVPTSDPCDSCVERHEYVSDTVRDNPPDCENCPDYKPEQPSTDEEITSVLASRKAKPVPTGDGGGELYQYEAQIGRDEARALDHTMLALRTENAELKRRLDFLESVGDENGGWCEHERRYQRTSGGDGDHCYICERDELKARVARRKTDEKKERHDEAD